MTGAVFGMNTMLADMEPVLRRLTSDRIDLAYRQTAGLWPVEAPPGQVEEVLLALAIEACEAMATTGGVLLVETANRHSPSGLPKGEYAVLSVSDSVRRVSHGVRAAVQGQDRREGRGIRLGIEIAEALGGRLDLAPLPGGGLSVQLTIPRAPGVAPKLPMDAGELQARGETILVVEDDQMMMSATRRILTRLGYAVMMASSAEAALEQLEALDGPIDLLLTDVMLPGKDGLLLAREIRARRPTVKVLAMTGFSGEAVRLREAMEPGMPLLEKPFTVDGLARAVRAALG